MAVAGPNDVTTARRVAVAASPWRRLVAGAVDAVIIFGLTPVVARFQDRPDFLPHLAVAVSLIAVVVAYVVNEYVLVARTGQSVGKRLLGTRVVDSSTMLPPRIGQIIWRNIVLSGLAGIGWHPFGGAMNIDVNPWPVIAFAPAFFDKQWHRGLHDRFAHTVVIDVRGERD